MSEVAQRTPTPSGALLPVPRLARTHSGPEPRPAEGAGAPRGLQLLQRRRDGLQLTAVGRIVDSIDCQSQSRMKAEWTLAG